MNNGFIKVAAAIPYVRIGDTYYNIRETIKQVVKANLQGVEIIVFPELGVTGYSCQDLFRSRLLLDSAENALQELKEATKEMDIVVIVGMPIESDSALLNCAVVVQRGKVLSIVPKTYLPNYGEFYEKRWFISARDVKFMTVHLCGEDIYTTTEPKVFAVGDSGVRFGIEICEDVWAPVPPSSNLALAGADIIFNLSASPLTTECAHVEWLRLCQLWLRREYTGCCLRWQRNHLRKRYAAGRK